MKYTICIRSNEHPRTINHFRNARTNFSLLYADTKEGLVRTIKELINNGHIVLYASLTKNGNKIDISSLKGDQ